MNMNMMNMNMNSGPNPNVPMNMNSSNMSMSGLSMNSLSMNSMNSLNSMNSMNSMNSAGGSNMNNLMMQMNSDMMMSGNDEEVSKTLFLGDLSVYCTEKDIRQLFRPFGVIESIRLKKGSANSTRLGYGFIQFSLREAAEQALNHLNGIMFLGRVMRINWAVPKAPTKVKTPKDTKKADTAQVHVSFISKQVDVLITEATLRNLFGLYGDVIDVALKKSQLDKNLRLQHGYGFVHYPFTEQGVRSAMTAMNALHQVTIDRVTYDCSMSHVLEEYFKQLEVTQPPQENPALPPTFQEYNFTPSNLLAPPLGTTQQNVPPQQHQQHHQQLPPQPPQQLQPSAQMQSQNTYNQAPVSRLPTSLPTNFQPGMPKDDQFSSQLWMQNQVSNNKSHGSPLAHNDRSMYRQIPENSHFLQKEQHGYNNSGYNNYSSFNGSTGQSQSSGQTSFASSFPSTSMNSNSSNLPPYAFNFPSAAQNNSNITIDSLVSAGKSDSEHSNSGHSYDWLGNVSNRENV